MMKIHDMKSALNADGALARLAALADAMPFEGRPQADARYVNNHIHTTYSFSPYSPTCAIYMAAMNGLPTLGIMDHDSLSGAREFIAAGAIAGIQTTIGIETRVSVAGTPLEGRRINNPDQLGNMYVAVHGIPHPYIDDTEAFLKPYRDHRNTRNVAMVERINAYLKDYGIALDFGRDVVPLSMSHDGGSITERHICYALAHKIVEVRGMGQPTVSFLTDTLGIDVSPKLADYLLDVQNTYYYYDLLGVLKSGMVKHFYIDATDECPHVTEFIRFAKSVNGYAAYPYLGDVTDSVTGDKKAQTFEDRYLDELFEVVKDLGFNAITYMPTRNTLEQLQRVQALCKRHDMFEICGEDINSPRQAFICKALEDPAFKHLCDATYALIQHERKGSPT